MDEAEALCGRLAFIQAGRIVAGGSVRELQAAIGYGIRCDIEVRGLSAAVLGAIAGDPDRATEATSPTGSHAVRVETSVTDENGVAELIGAIVRAGGEILSCRTRPPSLEEIYVRTLGGSPPAVARERRLEPVADPSR
jgi:ABC-2 type transport system ATP-binding protein